MDGIENRHGRVRGEQRQGDSVRAIAPGNREQCVGRAVLHTALKRVVEMDDQVSLAVSVEIHEADRERRGVMLDPLGILEIAGERPAGGGYFGCRRWCVRSYCLGGTRCPAHRKHGAEC